MRSLVGPSFAIALLLANLTAQHEAPPAPAAEGKRAPAGHAATESTGGTASKSDQQHKQQHDKSAGEQKRGSQAAATHAPRLALHPLVLFEHVKSGNAAAAAARAKLQPLPEPQERPAGAGRYVCAVVVCSDCDLDVPKLLGLRREDVLLVTTPGPFADAELVAQLERAVRDDGVRLVLVLGHGGCRLQKPADDALGKRFAVARKEAERRQQALGRTIVQMQRELLLVASELLTQRVGKDELRVFPGEIDPTNYTLQWHHGRIDELPLLPVK